MQQHPGGGPVPLVGQLTDRASSRRNPLFNSNNLLMGDAQSSLSIALIGSDNPHSTFSVDAADTDVDVDAQEKDLYSREVKEQAARERAEEATNSMALIVAAADSAQWMCNTSRRSAPAPYPHPPLPNG